MQTLLFLSSGLFLGWSLGANDAANVFGTAVGTRMLSFRAAALIGSVFVIIGAMAGGSGTAETLGRLGSIQTLPGAFTVALAAALTILWMTRLGLPVSTTQGIVGAIVGWNIYSQVAVNQETLIDIVGTWVFGPILAAVFAVMLFGLASFLARNVPVGIFVMDAFTRFALAVAGAFGAYSLGANNIANVMGVFTEIGVFGPAQFLGLEISGRVQLFALGGVAVSVGIITYSRKVMETVGTHIYQLSPVAALIVVLSSSLVLFLFASEELKMWLTVRGLPSLPLVPVSSSQAVVGAVVGIGIAKGGRNVRYGKLATIASGWVTTPLAAGIASYMLLFFMDNVFLLQV